MQNVPALTSIRFVAALIVFFHHYLILGGTRHFGADPDGNVLYVLMYEGRYGVSLFFVLSGFLLTARYYESIHRKIGFRKYWIKRFARIMPLYWTLCFGVFLLAVLRGRDIAPFGVFFSLTQGFFSDLKFHGVETAWSLTVEETFYLSLPVLIVLFRIVWREGRALWANVAAISLLLALVTVGYWQAGQLLHGVHQRGWFTAWGFFGRVEDIRAYTIFGRFFDFAVGCVFGMLFHKSSNAILQRRWLPDVAIVLSVAAILVASYHSHFLSGPEGRAGWWLLMPNAVFSAAIIYFVCSGTSRIAWFLTWRPFVYLGLVSYAFYLVHKIVFTNWMYRWCEAHEVPMFVAMVGLYAVLSVLAAICYEVIERPCQALVLWRTGVIPEIKDPPPVLRWAQSFRDRWMPSRSPAREEA